MKIYILVHEGSYADDGYNIIRCFDNIKSTHEYIKDKFPEYIKIDELQFKNIIKIKNSNLTDIEYLNIIECLYG